MERDTVVIGGGFGGCYLLHLLRKYGYSAVLLEAAPRLGGVWATSCYPGARVDCELPYYGFSDPAIWSTWNWTERFPSYRELRDYFVHVDKVWGLSQDVLFNSRVNQVVWEEDSHTWLISTADNQKFRSTWALAATGTSFKPNIPDIKGMDRITGQMHHSAAVDCIQVMQESAKAASRVVQYIRTPNFAVPMRQRQISEDEIYHSKPHIPHVFKACKQSPSGLPFSRATRKTFDDSEAERLEVWEENWRRGGFNFGLGSYADTIISKEANYAAYAFWRAKIRARITDPQKADILAPETPPYFIGTKRPSLEQDYFEMCDRPNVDIINNPITEVTNSGIVTEDGRTKEFDIIAVCTGYDAVTGGLRTMGIKGRNGLDLGDKWKDGVSTFLGMTVAGYPNMFIVYGPQAPTSLTNGPPFIELQCEWILNVLNKQRDEKLTTVEAKKEREEAWREHTLDLASKTLSVQTDSWWTGANVKGKKREFLLYMGGMPVFFEAANKALEGWSGFDVKPVS
ncbi:hypothetical protein M409DRAFT_24084 [Zasmidium cellare ATCC 36951]|uniref:FAD/NAD(P)-binding domain-containing protein n=1 Tax=Zasmidium cellare ATCC 36951 TaxID=1080233 RepID=A0A6A6CEZ6_ZASCE|nr:uncharacterized protein M409DRAFT_24084 [Zasmidium cellare ATCC 36951]KAF2165797.1 hypothetical protein M409DRAFT_24084 [Zasmidium cellare ATCC 36951]